MGAPLGQEPGRLHARRAPGPRRAAAHQQWRLLVQRALSELRNRALSGGYPAQSIIALAIIALFGPVAHVVAKLRLQQSEWIDLAWR
jgi:hypothetical protein